MATFDAPGEDTEDSIDLPKVLEDAEQPKEGEPGTSKSKGKTGDPPAQTEEGAEAPPEVTPPDSRPTDPQPGTSTDPPRGSSGGSHQRSHPNHPETRRGTPTSSYCIF